MTDLISRADARGAVQDHFNAYGFKGYYDGQQMMDRINALPPAEAEWIPCSERLPEDGVDVLITTENEEVYIDQVITDPYKERYFQSNTGYDNFQVLAWMPLPEPYREDGEV